MSTTKLPFNFPFLFFSDIPPVNIIKAPKYTKNAVANGSAVIETILLKGLPKKSQV